MEVTGVRRLTPEMRNQLRKQQTRTVLLEAAAAVFAARGFHAASLDEIAEAAGYTKGAIYSNFGGKAELFLALVQERRAAMLEQFFPAADPAAHPDPGERLAAVSDVYRRLVPTESEYALWAEFELYALRDPELREQLREEGRQQFALLVELVRHHLSEMGVVNPPLAPEHLARLFMAVFDSLSRQRVMEPEAVPDDLFATLTNFINDAIQGSASRTARSRARKAR